MKTYTNAQIIKKIKNGRVKFLIEIPFREFVRNQDGISMLNDFMDESVEDGYLLMDMTYKAKAVKDDFIVVQVDADATDYIKEEA